MADTHKLSEKQFNLYTEAKRRAEEAAQAFEAARLNLGTVSALILDFHGVDPEKSHANVDEATRTLVVTPKESPAAPAAPTAPAGPQLVGKRKRQKQVPPVPANA